GPIYRDSKAVLHPDLDLVTAGFHRRMQPYKHPGVGDDGHDGIALCIIRYLYRFDMIAALRKTLYVETVACDGRRRSPPAVRLEQVLVQLQPKIIQLIWAIVGIVDRNLSVDRGVLLVEGGADQVVGPVLPIHGPRLPARTSDLITVGSEKIGAE